MPGIGAKRERQLWASGVDSWEAFRRHRSNQLVLFVPAGHMDVIDRSEQALAEGDVNYFAQHLPAREHWRIALAFPSRTMFLDIETTGLSRYYHAITMVGWSMAGQYGAYFAHKPDEALHEALRDARIVTTFNGSHFDLPFLRTAFPDIELPPVHVDLRYAARRLGLRGSQKQIEQAIGWRRSSKIADLSGREAPELWRRYQRGELGALRRLVLYNHADVEGLRVIFREFVDRTFRSYGFPPLQRSTLKVTWPKSKLYFVSTATNSPPSGIRLDPYEGPVGPRLTYSSLPMPELRVVGIDLTGSERRASGWALLTENRVETAQIKNDGELISRTLEARPNLVSIDAPLSLPRGRLSPWDDDPGRHKHGIIRECERVLMRRGISAYPCLIRSMQALTERGIRLAACLRSEGLPVIESFPGAMQDILGIARKAKDPTWLRQGLIEYGLIGDFETKPVSHDELDAISCAVVGQLYWAGYTESLGNRDEDFLIIPTVEAEKGPRFEVVGLSGRTASGKTTVAERLVDRGFTRIGFSGVLADLLRDRGEPVSHEALQRVGSEIHHDPGQRWLDERVADRIGDRGGRFVIDGLRFPSDHAFFAQRFKASFIHLHIDANATVRKDRFLARGGSIEAFRRIEENWIEGHTDRMRRLADFRLTNDNSLGHLWQSLERVAEALRLGQGREPCR